MGKSARLGCSVIMTSSFLSLAESTERQRKESFVQRESRVLSIGGTATPSFTCAKEKL